MKKNIDRRKAMKIFAGCVVAGGAGSYGLSSFFRPVYQPFEEPRKVEYKPGDSCWQYTPLDPDATADLAYSSYPDGSCMYAVCRSIVSQLADKYGEPYASFPYHMMKYGRSGIGGYGTVCGALNGAAAVIGLLVEGNSNQDALITGLFRWYEEAAIPEFSPRTPILDFTPPGSVPGSTICHASISNWVRDSGHSATSDQRVERCRRLTADVAARTTLILNEYHGNVYTTAGHDNREVRECMTCHGSTGKLNDTFGKMTCSSCHTKSIPHRIFANPHYKLKNVD